MKLVENLKKLGLAATIIGTLTSPAYSQDSADKKIIEPSFKNEKKCTLPTVEEALSNPSKDKVCLGSYESPIGIEKYSNGKMVASTFRRTGNWKELYMNLFSCSENNTISHGACNLEENSQYVVYTKSDFSFNKNNEKKFLVTGYELNPGKLITTRQKIMTEKQFEAKKTKERKLGKRERMAYSKR